MENADNTSSDPTPVIIKHEIASSNAASGDEKQGFFSRHTWTIIILIALCVVSGPFLAAFGSVFSAMMEILKDIGNGAAKIVDVVSEILNKIDEFCQKNAWACWASGILGFCVWAASRIYPRFRSASTEDLADSMSKSDGGTTREKRSQLGKDAKDARAELKGFLKDKNISKKLDKSINELAARRVEMNKIRKIIEKNNNKDMKDAYNHGVKLHQAWVDSEKTRLDDEDAKHFDEVAEKKPGGEVAPIPEPFQ